MKYAVCFPCVPIVCDFFFHWSDELRSGHAPRVLKAIKACACVCTAAGWLRVTHLNYYYAAFSLSAPEDSRQEKVTSGFYIHLDLLKEPCAGRFSSIQWHQWHGIWCFHLYHIMFFLYQLKCQGKIGKTPSRSTFWATGEA